VKNNSSPTEVKKAEYQQFLNRNHRGQEKLVHFLSAEELSMHNFLYPAKISLKNEGEPKTFSNERKLRVCYQCIYTKTMTKVRFLKQKGNDKSRNLEIPCLRKNPEKD
jgi:hypothetical protein